MDGESSTDFEGERRDPRRPRDTPSRHRPFVRAAFMGESKRKRGALAEFLKHNPICCFCGGPTLSTTIDHVPSRQMFAGRLRPKWLEVPACHDCNQDTRNHEQVAAMLGRLYPDPATVAERAEMERIMRAVSNNISGLLEEMRPSQRQQERFEEAKHLPPIDSNALNCNGPLLNRSIQLFGAKLGLALQYATTGRIIPCQGGAGIPISRR
jgi:hypothetical protein